MSIPVIFLAALGLSIDAFTISFTGGILTLKKKADLIGGLLFILIAIINILNA